MVISAVTVGIISGVMIMGVMQGWIEQRMHDAIYNEVSHIQIHNKEYLGNEEPLFTVIRPEEVISSVEALPGVRAFVQRTKLTAMAATPWAATGLFIYGIDPEKEKSLSEIYKKIVPGAGEYIDKNKDGTILISDKTAEILKLKHYIITSGLFDRLGGRHIPYSVMEKLDSLKEVRFRSPKDFREALRSRLSKKELDKYGKILIDSALDYRIRSRIQITLTDSAGNPVQGTFRVCGIYKTTNTGYDQMSAFVNAGELASLCGTGKPMIHEIAVLLHNIEDAESVRRKLSSLPPGNIVSTWKDLAPDAAYMNDFMILYYFIIIGIIMFALAFGIINTMMMAILERTKELGMLMAIGMNRRKIFSMIMLETTFLTGVGAVAGMISGWLIVSMLGKTGIHFAGWGEGFEAIGFAAVVYPYITTEFFIFVILMVIATAVLSSVWPARKALKLNPVETLRTE